MDALKNVSTLLDSVQFALEDLYTKEVVQPRKTTVEKEVCKLITHAMRLNCDEFHVSVGFTGHVDWIEVDIMPGGWKTCDKLNTKVSFYIGLNREDSLVKLTQANKLIHYAHEQYTKYERVIGTGDIFELCGKLNLRKNYAKPDDGKNSGV